MTEQEGTHSTNPALYGRYVLLIAGLGGLLYGIDVGIISAALLYLGKTIDLTVGQTSAVVAAVLGGSMLSSLIAGLLADWFGRKRMMIFSGFLFITSVALIVLSSSFPSLFVGRLLQGMSGGVIAVVVPLYLAECLSANTRGRGSAIFQFMLTLGIVIAALTGFFYIHQAEAAIAVAANNTTLIRAAQNHAWRGMFLSVIYPGLAFFVGAFFLSETPRWLFRQGRRADALAALRRSTPEAEAQTELREMEQIVSENQTNQSGGWGTLLRRKYVLPFALACIILGLNQATGINSILGYLAVILKQAGMSADRATQGDLAVKVLNCVMTVFAVLLIDKKGRKFLLSLGTGGVVVSLLLTALFFHTFEANRVDLKGALQQKVQGEELTLGPSTVHDIAPNASGAQALTVLYSYGGGDKLATLVGNDTVQLQPEKSHAEHLVIRHAFLGPLPAQSTGWLIAACLGLFITFYSVGPGVVVWLTLSELMPTRIRSAGMGIALLINQGVSTLIAGVFLPVVSRYGYYAMFLTWAGCTVLYFLVAVLFLPETKGKTLEEIEKSFERA